jgi:uncharacterized protein YhfF
VSADGLPTAEFGFPSALRDRLVAAILSGEKTSTTGLLEAYEVEDEALPEPGQRLAVLDSGERPVAVIEITEVRVARLGDVDLAHAVDEGEGDETLDSWRAKHEEFFHSPRDARDPGPAGVRGRRRHHGRT